MTNENQFQNRIIKEICTHVVDCPHSTPIGEILVN
jgi:hypothetical protein